MAEWMYGHWSQAVKLVQDMCWTFRMTSFAEFGMNQILNGLQKGFTFSDAIYS